MDLVHEFDYHAMLKPPVEIGVAGNALKVMVPE